MYHHRSRLRLNKKPDHAWMLQRNLVTSLLLYEAIRTTRKQAKVIQPMIDRLITDAKKSTPFNAVRTLHKVVTDTNASRKVMEVLIKRYANRSSGFTSITPAGSRKGDGAAIVDLVLMDRDMAIVSEQKTPKNPTSPKKPKKVSKTSSDSSASSVSSASSK